jgi:adenylate kinase
LAKSHQDFRHITASQLISGGFSLVDRRADEVYASQVEIVERVRELRKIEQRRVILDGHCVIRLATSLYQLPKDFIVALAPATIILIEAQPEIIQMRQAERDSVRLGLDEVSRELAVTRETCLSYQRDLSIPLRVLNGDRTDVADELFGCLT